MSSSCTSEEASPNETQADRPVPPAQCDVLVVGAGIAGASAARLLAARGYEVLLVDRATFPRYKVCGCCLNLRSIAALRQAGVMKDVDTLGVMPLTHLELSSHRRRARVPLPGGYAVSRAALDSCLVRAACAEGARFLDGTTAKIGPVVGQFRSVVLRSASKTVETRARVVLAADGLQGTAREKADAAARTIAHNARVGIGTLLPEAPAGFELGHIYMACGAAGYAGLVRVEDGQLAIAAAVDPEYLRQCDGPAHAVEQLLKNARLPLIPALHDSVWKGTPPLTQQPATLSEERLLVIGDAGGYVEPFTGEGMAWAMESARAASVSLAAGLDGDWSARCRTWNRLRRREMRRQRRICHAMARLLRSPVATHMALSALTVSTTISRPILRRINAPSRS